jgi:hypothetical protein
MKTPDIEQIKKFWLEARKIKEEQNKVEKNMNHETYVNSLIPFGLVTFLIVVVNNSVITAAINGFLVFIGLLMSLCLNILFNHQSNTKENNTKFKYLLLKYNLTSDEVEAYRVLLGIAPERRKW